MSKANDGVVSYTLPDEVRRPAGHVFRCALGYTYQESTGKANS